MTYGQGPVIVVVFTNSPAPLSFSVDDPNVASISNTTDTSAEITLVGAGSTNFTVTQSAISGYAAGTFSRTLTVAKATQSALMVDSVTGATGQFVALSATGGTTAGTVSFTLTGSGGGACSLSGNQLSRGSDGFCTVTATRAGDSNHEEVTSAPHTIEFVSVVHGTADENGTITLVAPAGTHFSSVVFASYGTPTGTAGNFTQGSCHATTSVDIVAELALLQTSATISATNGVFGDPCGGTYKRLYVSLAFAPIGSTSSGILLYEVTNPKRGDAITYSEGYGTGASEPAKTFDTQGRTITRVIYYMQVRVDGVLRFAEVSFDPWAGLTAWDLRVPELTEGNSFDIRRIVENMTVVSNMSSRVSDKSTGITNGSGRRGYLEIWPWNYDTSASGGGPAGSSNSRFDFNDSPGINSGRYGSFQVHDVTGDSSSAYRTIMAWNRHDSNREGPLPEVGLGSYAPNISGRHPDWTFTVGDDLGSVDWKLQIRVEATPPPQPIAAVACHPQAGTSPGNQTCAQAFVAPGVDSTVSKYYSYDSNLHTAWVDLGAHYDLTSFQVWTADDSGGLPGRNPVSFAIYSSNADKTTVSAIATGAPNCPAQNVSPCATVPLALNDAHRYLIIEFSVQAGASDFQISRGLFLGYPGVAPAASAVSTNSDGVEADGNDETVEEPAPDEETIADETPVEESTPDDSVTPDDSEESDDALADELLVGVLALGARADNSSRQTKRKRRTRHWRTR